jgi:ATP-dependent exoDNAse (exonuclease V) beta subunit
MSETFRFISAGAGSGKTYRLTQVLHNMLADGRVRPAGILATTFTNKAAAELRERVRAHLIEKGQYTLATHIGQARIGTVNSVCGNLLARFAFEAGMPVDQLVLDEARATQLLKESIDEVIEGKTLTQLLTVARRLCLDQVVRGDGKDPWRAALRDIVGAARSNDIAPEKLRTLGTRNADQLLALFPAVTSRNLDDELLTAIRGAIPFLRQAQTIKAQKNTGEYLQQIEDFERNLRDGHFHWAQWNKLAKEDAGAKHRATVQAIANVAAEHATHPRLQADVREYLETLFSLAADVLEKYRARKRELGAVDFTDQECELLAILDKPQVAETLSAELDLLMVDEFQDTSPIQLALFLKFTEYAKHVVWVGDVKQAIYGFRGGDATLMSAVVGGLAAFNCVKEPLTYSYRSRPPLVYAVNQLFGGAFAGLTPNDVHLQPKRADHTGANAIEDWLLDGKADDQYHGIGAGIATLIQSGAQICDPDTKRLRPVRLGDIAVLVRANDTVDALAAVLQSRGLMASTEQPGLLDRPEVVLALACLRRVNDDRDTIATAEIVSLAGCEDPDDWLEDRLAYLDRGDASATWRETGNVQPIFEAIKTLRAQRLHLSPQEAVQLVLTRCHLGRCVLQWQQSPERARLRLVNLDRLTELAAEYEEACRSTREAATLSGLLLWLSELADEGADTMPQPAVDAVQVMTHHGAKGLEWPVVILVDLAGNVKDSIWDSVRAESMSGFDMRQPLKDRHLRYWPWPYGAQKNVQVATVVAASPTAQVIRAAAVEEHKRLLYVSMTRARDLIVIARATKKPDGEWMGTIGLGNFLPAADVTSITLDSGKAIPFLRRHLTPDSAALAPPTSTRNLRWFDPPVGLREKLPLTVSPSLATPIAATVTETVKIGTRIAVDPATDFALLGEAVHACLAVYLSAKDVSMSEDDIDAVLRRNGIEGVVSAAAVLRQLGAVRSWLAARWPDAESIVEIPIAQVLDNGQIINGRIDLLLKTKAGWILIDHKSGAQNSTQWDKLAAGYGGQLAAYGGAIKAATGVSVVESWLVLPVAGVALRVTPMGDFEN